MLVSVSFITTWKHTTKLESENYFWRMFYYYLIKTYYSANKQTQLSLELFMYYFLNKENKKNSFIFSPQFFIDAYIVWWWWLLYCNSIWWSKQIKADQSK